MQKIAGIMFCAFTFIQCSDHYTIRSGTFNGDVPQASYQGQAKVNGHKAKKHFNLGYASGIVGNDKAFIKVK